MASKGMMMVGDDRGRRRGHGVQGRASFQEEPPSGVGHVDGQYCSPSQSMPTAISTAWLPPRRPRAPFHSGRRGSVGEGLGKGARGEGVEAYVQTLVDGGDGGGRKAWPHSSSVIALTFRVETPCRYISVNVATKACSDAGSARRVRSRTGRRDPAARAARACRPG